MTWDVASFQETMEFQVILGRQTVVGYISMLERASLLTEGPRLREND